MLRKLYARALLLAERPGAAWWLAAVSFAEASFFPLPPDVLLVPMVLAKPRRAWFLAALCTAASVAGAVLGYLIGAALFRTVALPVLQAYHYVPQFEALQAAYARRGVMLILVKGLTPIPFKLVTIASGVLHFGFAPFLMACALTRGARFFLLAGLLWAFGDKARVFIERWLTPICVGFLVALVAGVVGLRYL